MANKIKCMAALLLAFCVVLTGLSGMATPVSAAEAHGSYVLQYDDLGQPYLYGSRYQCDHSYNDPAAGPNSVWSFYNAPEIFNLVYTGPEGSHSIAAYCTDADTSTYSGGSIYYRRLNLEDSTYHESGAAERLRAVLLHSFPFLSIDAVSENANLALGEGSIQQLTQGEVISATQQAIWEITHGEKYSVDNNYVGLRGMNAYDTAQFVYPQSLEDCVHSDYTEGNIRALYQYFLDLPGQAPMADAVSEYSIKDVVYDAVRQEDGTYTVTVSYTIDADIREGDALTLTVACGGQTRTEDLAGGAGSAVFEGLSDKSVATLTISGTQTGGDVYLFDAEGDRSSSQSMVGFDTTTLPVFAQVVAEPDRVINIYKSTNEGENKRPLSNIEFEIFLVATMDDIVTGEVQLSEKPTEEEIAAYTQTAPVVTLKTDAQGFASYNLTDNGHPDGVYLVVEKENSAVIAPIEPFFVAVPGTNEAGDGHVYTVTVHPKNTVEVGPEIRKDVTEIENNEDSFDVDQIHKWIVRSDIPAGLAGAEKYEITDRLDYRLTLKGGLKVTVARKTDMAGTENVALIPGTDYAVNTGTAADGEGNPIDTFSVALTNAGMKAAAAAAADGRADYEIRVYFDAIIDSDAQLGVEIPNQAKLQYINGSGIEYFEESDIPVVYTGGIGLLKLDSADESPLMGAAFRIARDATSEEVTAGVSEALTVNEEEHQVVFTEFYADADLREKVSEYTSGEDGKIRMYGLSYGTYYIVETKAPRDYNLLTEPVTVEINGTSHLDEAMVTVYNTRFLLPETGGMGTGVFTLLGIICIGGALVISAGCLRKKEI